MIDRSLMSGAMLLLGALAAGCGGSDDGDVHGGKSAAQGTPVTVRFQMHETDKGIPFMTPNAAIDYLPKANLVGKPIMFVVYPAQFSPGNDPPLHAHWDTVPADLQFDYKTPALAQKEVDVALVIYDHSQVPAEARDNPSLAPFPKGGDVSAISFAKVRAGEQNTTPGVIRLYLDEGQTELSLENRVPADPTNKDEVGQSFINSLMVLP